MSQDDPGLDLYEILTRNQRNGRPVLGQRTEPPPAKTAKPVVPKREAPLVSPVKTISGPVPPFSPAATGKTTAQPAPAKAAAAPPAPAAPATIPTADPAGPAAGQPMAPLAVGKQRLFSEVTLDINTLFFLSLTALALIAASYILGYRKGWEEALRSRGGETTSGTEGAVIARSKTAPPNGTYVLLLKSYNRQERLQEELERIAAEVLRDLRQKTGKPFDIALFYNEDNRVYLLAATGGFTEPQTPGLTELKSFFDSYEGPGSEKKSHPYMGSSVLRVGEPMLGRFVPPS